MEVVVVAGIDTHLPMVAVARTGVTAEQHCIDTPADAGSREQQEEEQRWRQTEQRTNCAAILRMACADQEVEAVAVAGVVIRG